MHHVLFDFSFQTKKIIYFFSLHINDMSVYFSFIFSVIFSKKGIKIIFY